VRDAAEFLAAGGVASLHAAPAPQQLRSGGLDALAAARRTREAGGTVVATGGCFDLLHAGHARTLSAARRLGDCLIVCLNSDDSVRRLKGDERPIMSQQDRAELLLSLECVDGVLIFEEDTPEAALDRLRPDIWVKGGDYSVEQLPEAQLVASWGGQTMTVPYHPARSTTRLAEALAKVG
jgi:rfaE bifunctional protein nucleotidyltransferase chain/domain